MNTVLTKVIHILIGALIFGYLAELLGHHRDTAQYVLVFIGAYAGIFAKIRQ